MINIQLRVLFLISGFSCEPAALSRVLGVDGTRIWKAGDLNEKSRAPYRSSGWMLEAPANGGEDLEALARWLVDRLPANLQEIESVSPLWTSKLFCSIYTSGERPALFLSAETIQRLAALGAATDIDLYVLPEDEPSNDS